MSNVNKLITLAQKMDKKYISKWISKQYSQLEEMSSPINSLTSDTESLKKVIINTPSLRSSPEYDLYVAFNKLIVSYNQALDAVEQYESTESAISEYSKKEEPCDHYWLARRGGVCPKCGKEFKPNFG